MCMAVDRLHCIVPTTYSRALYLMHGSGRAPMGDHGRSASPPQDPMPVRFLARVGSIKEPLGRIVRTRPVLHRQHLTIGCNGITTFAERIHHHALTQPAEHLEVALFVV